MDIHPPLLWLKLRKWSIIKFIVTYHILIYCWIVKTFRMVLLNTSRILQLDRNMINNYYRKQYCRIIGLVVFLVPICMLMRHSSLWRQEIFEEQLEAYVVWVALIKHCGPYCFARRTKIQISLNRFSKRKIWII